MNVPQKFTGTEAERAANWETHHFGPKNRCWECDCRPWGRVADWPCGQEPPRVIEEPNPEYLVGMMASLPEGAVRVLLEQVMTAPPPIPDQCGWCLDTAAIQVGSYRLCLSCWEWVKNEEHNY